MIVLLAPGVRGQQRPLLTEDPRTIPAGAVVTELGVGYFNRARFPLSGLGGNLFSLLENGIHFGLSSRAEFQMRGVLWNVLNVRENGGGTRSDFGDMELSTKLVLIEETRSRPVVSFRPLIVLPNAKNESGLGSDTLKFFGTVLVGKSAGPLFVFGNVGLGILDEPTRAASQHDVLRYGIAAALRVAPGLRAMAEVSGIENARANPRPGGEDRRESRLGFRYTSRAVTVDVAGTAGLSRWDHRAGLVIGISREFRFRRR